MRKMTIEIPSMGCTEKERLLIEAVHNSAHPLRIKFLGSLWELTGVNYTDSKRSVFDWSLQAFFVEQLSPAYYNLTFQRLSKVA